MVDFYWCDSCQRSFRASADDMKPDCPYCSQRKSGWRWSLLLSLNKTFPCEPVAGKCYRLWD